MHNKRGKSKAESSTMDQDMDIRTIMKDIQLLGSPYMTWKEKKELENRKVVSLGGKPPKKQRLPLSVARVVMKKQKEREEKMLQESSILGRFGGIIGSSSSSKRSTERNRPEDRVLKSSEGHFKNGVLNVKHLLRPTTASREPDNNTTHGPSKGKKRKGKPNNRGKKGKGKKRH